MDDTTTAIQATTNSGFNPNWMFINNHRLRSGMFGTSNSDGFNGAFDFNIPGEARRVCVIASDGMGWRHVSVSFGAQNTKIPPWNVMCAVKDIFFGKDCWVMQFHPPQSEYVNNHPGCLHLWQPTDAIMPVPQSIMVGYKELNPL